MNCEITSLYYAQPETAKHFHGLLLFQHGDNAVYFLILFLHASGGLVSVQFSVESVTSQRTQQTLLYPSVPVLIVIDVSLS